MPNRIIKESICTSAEIDRLTPFEENVFIRLMVNCDDFGRFDGRMKLLSSKLFPLKDISVEQMKEAIDALVAADLVTMYESDGKPYLFMNTWAKHQQSRATKSKYPAPEEIICNQMISDDINGNQPESSETKSPRIRNRIRIRNNDNRNRYSEGDNDDDDFIRIQKEHDEVISAAENAGFINAESVRAKLVELYAEHGKEKMIAAIESCVEHGAPKIAYLKAVLSGKPKKKETSATDIHGYEQRDYSDAQAEAMRRMMSDEWPGEAKGAG